MEMAAVGVETAAAVVTVASMATITAVFVTEVCCGGVSFGGISSGSSSGSGGGSRGRADHYHQPYLIYSHSDSCLCSNGDSGGGGRSIYFFGCYSISIRIISETTKWPSL